MLIITENGGFDHLLSAFDSDNEEDIINALKVFYEFIYGIAKHEYIEKHRPQLSMLCAKIYNLLKPSAAFKIQEGCLLVLIAMSWRRNTSELLFKWGLIPALVSYASDVPVYSLQALAIKILRNVGKVTKCVFVKRFGIVSTAASLLSTPDEDLFKAVVSLLVTFVNNLNVSVGQEMYGKDKQGYNIIVERLPDSSVSELFYNLCKNPETRAELSIAGNLLTKVLDVIRNKQFDKRMLQGFAYLCQEPLFRQKLRERSDGIGVFSETLKNPDMSEYHETFLKILRNFRFDDTGLKILVEDGLTDVLLQKLADYSHNFFICNLVECNQCPPVPQNYHTNVPVFEILRHLADRKLLASAFRSSEQISVLINTILSHGHYFTKLPKPPFSFNKFLLSLFSQQFPFKIIIEERLLLALDRSLSCQSTSCSHCIEINKEGVELFDAISHNAQAQIELILRVLLNSDSPQLKITAALTIPYIMNISNMRLCTQFLIRENALEYLLGALKIEEEGAAISLNKLFVRLDLNYGPSDFRGMCCKRSKPDPKPNITFSLDDGSTVNGNKEILAEECPMFEAMFSGSFQESFQSTIHLKDVSRPCLIHLFRSIYSMCACCLPGDVETLLEMVAVADRFLLPQLSENLLRLIIDSKLDAYSCCLVLNWSVLWGQKLNIASQLPNTLALCVFGGISLSKKDLIEATKRIVRSENCDVFLDSIRQLIHEQLTL